MKFSYSWLCDHLDTKLSPLEIAETLTNIGLELESLSDYSSYAQFVVATIVDFKKHPNADRLNICSVENGEKIFQVICGAPNVKKGMKGIFAADGMYIPGTDITLKKGKIRGEVSEGMLLSERELNLSDNHEGIIEVQGNLPNGTDAVTALNLNDPIFEVGVTPNRGDCLSVRGIARDLSAKGVGKLKPINIKKVTSEEFESPITWSIQNDGNSCSFVVSRYFKDIQNSTSPEWLQKKLLSIGLSPINALVDITNFITMDLGRPLHVFDADKIGNKLNMRLSNDQEKLSEVLLDKDLIIYLARKDPLNEMNKMTDLVFKTAEKFNPNALIIGSSSVHATGGAYFPFLKEPYKTIASREFNKLETWPKLFNANIEPCPTGDYGLEKAYVESWCQRFAVTNMNAIAARWGGINIDNKMIDEVAYFTVWCHQEDSAKFVDNCYKTFVDGKLRSGAHYYVISRNKYSIFDIETPKKEIGYNPIHDAEIFY